MFVEKTCNHFIFQEDRNGEMAISCCNAMTNPEQDHEGNNFNYSCPLGLNDKNCFKIISCGSTQAILTN
jgi:hypothetical protein